ncbi:hypothetical protein COS31_01545 [Candidatus Roizmanbacteria bacterium CG02_land_8_20_14_3_00_36_15]|uniref:MIP18 family-like domain-containing protein n=1 Tax=Candidatus Roizmanbacteria bacterium CG10_big_fil_rev_8_21_14_0_10_36_26 TaxID=1974851 RepID=A0A2M8KKV9_9BACT|nr:MAG: hypothetical protein COS51_05460 [Candidatus Roizmanbacteria bacterium CG03_land_8_20_14_0_80_36_21]PIV37987.1 MAG: hypothetical protein COS31_01545 [Candidatus Roizmanbacteria bacterium CG02_land_8_20_14_3_00_36_15]PIY70137.1 MAG: hypothetical protein COY89_02830 [Candidatus Roizmanbacteria bacterium CG_4_10_14_0_8_um_filter_36_36]PJA52829.1 MAG: hypothetical protein CO166_04135 [Candidatus Roizmanbacteria bacterium CG_4_9_14_3_um_filter_36_11]PJE60552.1 MAG: hypothetical protein COU86
MNKITQKQVKNKLSEVHDPELNISIIDLGLVYKIKFIKEKIVIIMTLTTIGCPLFDMIKEEIKNKLAGLGLAKKNIEIELTFDPPWSIERMTKKGKTMLGI